MLKKFREFVVAKNIKNFKQFENRISFLGNKEKGDLFEVLCYWFLKLNNLEKFDKIWHYSKLPDTIKEKLNLPINDKGIDFVASKTNDYYAIQAKFRTNRQKLTWEETATFAGLTFGSADGFKKGILITNVFDVPNEFKNNKYSIYDGVYLERHLSPIFTQITSLAIGNDILLQPRKLFNYQIPIFEQTVSYFNNSRSSEADNGILEIACGCGKTFIAYAITTKLKALRIICLVPSLFLLSQTFAEWIHEDCARNIKRQYLLLGSDLDSNIHDYRSYYDITTTSDDIKRFLKIKKDLVIISTYQSSPILLEVLNDSLWGPDFLIFDEAHKTCGQVEKHFSVMLKYEFPLMKKLFLTATPSFYEGNNENIISMNNKEIYGEVISKFNIGMAIHVKALTNYQVVVAATTENEIKRLINDKKWVFDDEIGKIKSDQLYKAIIIGKTIRQLKCTHILTYHKDIRSTIAFQELLKTIFKDTFPILQIDGYCSMKKRSAIISKFVNAKISVLCSSQVMNEGVNIPCIDAVCFIDPRNSVRDIIQCIGRCLRVKTGKKMSYVIIPEIVNNMNNDDQSQFKDIWTVIRALKNQDTEIKNYIINKINEKENTKVKLRIINPFIGSRSSESIDTGINIKEWSDKIVLRICHIAEQWEIMFLKLKTYVKTNKKYPSYTDKNIGIRKLGMWASYQRTIKNGKNREMITQERIQKLESLPGWFWNINFDSIWDKTLNDVKNYVMTNKEYPRNVNKDIKIKKLGRWISTQRKLKKGMGRGILTSERIQKLESLPGWFWNINLEFVWNEMFNEVKSYVNKYKKYPSCRDRNCRVKKMGRWISTQRKVKKGMGNGKLTPERIQKLESLPKWFWFW
jgi:predicted helicase